MRRTVLVASALVTASAVGAIGAAQASQATSGASKGGARYITVIERGTTEHFVDNPPTGDSPGDLLVFANPLFDRTNSKQVGHDNGSCIRTVAGKAWECSFTAILGQGSLTLEGPFYDTKDSRLAISGGTGAFSRAHGVMRLHTIRFTPTPLFRLSFRVLD